MTGGGFLPAAQRFFDDLEDDNSREFWQAHAEVFQREVREPMAALLDTLPESYQPFRILRMHRDLRFTKDKSPYKTQLGAMHQPGDGIDLYLHIGAEGLLVACGIYQMESDQVERYRRAVDDARHGAALERLLAALPDQGLDVNGMSVPSLKTAPRGYPKDHPRLALLRLKGVIGHRLLDGPELADAAAVHDFVVETFRACEPLAGWLRAQVGRSAVSSARQAP